MEHPNQRYMTVQKGLVNSKAFILFYYDEESDQIEIARDTNKLNMLETIGMAQIIDNYATELMANFGSAGEER